MIEEKAKKNDLRLVKLIWPYVTRETKLYIFAIFLMPFAVLLPLALPRIVKQIVDTEFAAGPTRSLFLWVGALVFFVLAQFTVTTIFQTLLRRIGLKITANLRRDLFQRMLTFPISFFRSEPKGRLVSRLTTDLDQIDDMFASGGLLLIADTFSVIAITVAMFTLSPELSLWGLSIIPVMGITISWISTRMREIARRVRVQTGKMNGFAQEALSAHDIVSVLGARKKFGDDFDELSREMEVMTVQSNRYEAAFFAGMDFFGSIAVAMIFWAATDSIVSAGLLIAMTQYIQQFFVPLRGLATRFATFQQAMVALERVEQFLSFEMERAEGSETEFPKAVPLSIRDLSFAYRKDVPVLSNVSLNLDAGVHLALLGETGSGKSTLARILIGFYQEQKGRIEIGGVEINSLSLACRRRTVALVPQEVFLFDSTLEENIAMGRKLDPARMKSIIESVNLGELNSRAATVGEWGRRLSEGEKQLIAAARVIAYDPSLVVLDEATSALDPLLDAAVRSAIRKALTGRSAIIIAHRLSTLQSADRIAVMHKGKLVEEGTHEELHASGGTYSKLYRLLELVESKHVVTDKVRGAA